MGKKNKHKSNKKQPTKKGEIKTFFMDGIKQMKKDLK